MNTVQVAGGDGAVARALAARLRADDSGDGLGDTAGRGRDETAGRGRDGTAAALVIDLGPPEGRRERWRHALEDDKHVISASLDPGDALWAQQQWGEPAVARGVTFVPNGGAAAVIGEALVVLAAEALGLEATVEVHVSHLVAERGGLQAVAGTGLRRELAHLVGAPALVRSNGQFIEEPAGERRRLAWFARPVGPHHAASVPAPEVVTAARRLPSHVALAGHLAMATWRAELLQASANVARTRQGRRWVSRHRLRARGGEPEAGARWAVVAEARAESGEVVRAWANGRDLAATNAATLHLLADRVALGPRVPGTPAVTELVAPADLLDQLAEAVALRWSVVRPTAQDDAQGDSS